MWRHVIEVYRRYRGTYYFHGQDVPFKCRFQSTRIHGFAFRRRQSPDLCSFCNIKQVTSLVYTGCPGENVPDFGSMLLKLKYTDITKNSYIRIWTFTEIMAREKWGLLAVSRTVPGSRDVLPIHCACPSFSLQPSQSHSRCDCTCKVLGTLRTTTTLVRVFMWFNLLAPEFGI